MVLISESTRYIIDSSQRTSGTSSDFQFQINLPKGEYDSVCMLYATIPKSYWLVNAPYNTFTLTELGVPITITVAEGNYNVRSWNSIVGAQLTAASLNGWTYTISIANSSTEVETGLLNFTVSGNGLNQPSFLFPSTSTIHQQMGFMPDTTYTFSSNILSSVHVVKFQVEDVLYIHSNISYNNDQSDKSDVLQEIYAGTTPPFASIIFQNQGNVESYSKLLRSPNNNVFKFTITDRNNVGINLRGVDWNATIVCYKKDAINNIIARHILESRQFLQ